MLVVLLVVLLVAAAAAVAVAAGGGGGGWWRWWRWVLEAPKTCVGICVEHAEIPTRSTYEYVASVEWLLRREYSPP